MKRLVILMLIALTTTLLPACKKYEDGPYISFVSRKERVVNAWKIDKVYKKKSKKKLDLKYYHKWLFRIIINFIS